MKQARMKKIKVFTVTLSLAVLSLLCLQGCGAKKEAVSEEEAWAEESSGQEDWEAEAEPGEEGREEKEASQKTAVPFEQLTKEATNEEIFLSLDTSKFDPDKFDGKFIVSFDIITCTRWYDKEYYWDPEKEYYNDREKTKEGFVQEGVVALTWEELFLPDGLILSNSDGIVHNNEDPSFDARWWSDLGGFDQFWIGVASSDVSYGLLRDEYIQNQTGALYTKSLNGMSGIEEVFCMTPEIAEKWGEHGFCILIELLGHPSSVEEIESRYWIDYNLEWRYEKYTITASIIGPPLEEYRGLTEEERGVSSIDIVSNDLLD